MIHLIISDVHGNLPALELLLYKEKHNYDNIINLGDVVNYAPWSNECVELLNNQPNIINIKGNHEEYFISGSYSNPGKVSEIFFKVNFPFFNKIKIINAYKEYSEINDIFFTHTINGASIFKDTIVSTNKKYCIGHSHQQYHNELNEFSLINPGSVGQNRSLINVISYAFFNDETNDFRFENFIYNVDLVINEMVQRNFPTECISYYKNKNRA